jgi:hypothetical protein
MHAPGGIFALIQKSLPNNTYQYYMVLLVILVVLILMGVGVEWIEWGRSEGVGRSGVDGVG